MAAHQTSRQRPSVLLPIPALVALALILALWPLDARDRAAADAVAAAAAARSASPSSSYARSAVEVPCRRGGWRRGGICLAWLYEPDHPLPTSYGQLAAADARATKSAATAVATADDGAEPPPPPPPLPGAGVVLGPPLGAWRRRDLHRPADALARAGLTVLTFDYAAVPSTSASAAGGAGAERDGSGARTAGGDGSGHGGWVPAPATHGGLAKDWVDCADWLLAHLERPLPRDQVAAAVARAEERRGASSSSNNNSSGDSKRRPPVSARVALFAWDWSASPAARAAAQAGEAAGELPGGNSVDRVGAVVLANPWPVKTGGFGLLRGRAATAAAAMAAAAAPSTATVAAEGARLTLRGLRDVLRSIVGAEPLWSPLWAPREGHLLPPVLFQAGAGGGGGGGGSDGSDDPTPLVRSSFALLALPWWRALAADPYVPRIDVPLSFVAPQLGDVVITGAARPRRANKGAGGRGAANKKPAWAADVGDYASASKRGKYVNFEVVVDAARASLLRALAAEPEAGEGKAGEARPEEGKGVGAANASGAGGAESSADAFDAAMHNQAMFLHAVLGSEFEFEVDEALLEGDGDEGDDQTHGGEL
jgi:hypothetical protein